MGKRMFLDEKMLMRAVRADQNLYIKREQQRRENEENRVRLMERREENARRRNYKNLMNSNLPENVHRALAFFASTRHDVHKGGSDIFLNNCIGYALEKKLQKSIAGLETVISSYDDDTLTQLYHANMRVDVIFDRFQDMMIAGKNAIRYPEDEDSYIGIFMQNANLVEKYCADFLAAIDKQYETKYAPTGKLRPKNLDSIVFKQLKENIQQKRAKAEEKIPFENEWEGEIAAMYDDHGNYIGGVAEDYNSISVWYPKQEKTRKDWYITNDFD